MEAKKGTQVRGHRTCWRHGHLWSKPWRPVLSEPGLDFIMCERCDAIEWVHDRGRMTPARDPAMGRKRW